MKPNFTSACLLALLAAPVVAQVSAPSRSLPRPDDVLAVIELVNTHWQAGHPLVKAADTVYTSDPDHQWTFRPYTSNSPFWDNAAYHTGNMEVVKLYASLPDADRQALGQSYCQYSLDWAEAAQWMGATSRNRAEWRYDYGERPNHVLFGDWQICFQTYADLYAMQTAADPTVDHSSMIARAREVMEYEMSTEPTDYWWWADGLYMVMPVMTKLYRCTGNPLYVDKLQQYWDYSKRLMYDADEHLFYRDGKYVWPKHKTEASGKKDFWARGDGWVFAGLCKVMADTMLTEMRQTYLAMAHAVRASQQPEGYWTRSMLDPAQAPGPETSGTAFFCYGLLWGIRHGLLDRETYLPSAMRAWRYLTTVALQPDGRVGFVQPIGEKAIPGQVVNAQSTSNFGVGAFLLASCEMYRLCAE